MAVADSSIDPKLLESAKKEFLERGFELASLKDILRQGTGNHRSLIQQI